MRVKQKHHLIYDNKDGQEWVETVYKGEHQICTKMQWYCKKNVSKGFIRWLEFFIVRNKDRAEEL